jgi:hypothetical protein
MEKFGYLTIEEADIFISSHFLSSSKERTEWEALMDEDKQVLLINGFENIENNVFTGYKTYENQIEQWPRNGSEIVPDEIKAAQLYEALEIGFGDTTSYDAIEKGIQSESIGKISTSYFSNAFYNFNSSRIKSTTARKILNKYIKRVYDII